MKLKGATLTLNPRDTKRYEDKGETGDKFRREIREAARNIAARLGKPVTIYASTRIGGFVFEQVTVR